MTNDILDLLEKLYEENDKLKNTREHLAELPEHIQSGIERYLLQGIEPGSFLQAVIQNDLRLAIVRADAINRHRMKEVVEFFQFCVPQACRGSEAAYYRWLLERRDSPLAWNDNGQLVQKN